MPVCHAITDAHTDIHFVYYGAIKRDLTPKIKKKIRAVVVKISEEEGIESWKKRAT